MPARLVAVVGRSGSGKSTSLRNFPPEETFIVNIVSKRLPFRGASKKFIHVDPTLKTGNLFNVKVPEDESMADVLMKVIKFIHKSRPEIKYLILDDYQYLMSEEFMERAFEKGYDKFNDIARHAWMPLKLATGLRDDLTIAVLHHEEEREGGRKMKTIGKLLDEKVTLEGYFTYVVYTEIREEYEDEPQKRHVFSTSTKGGSTAKTPMDMVPKYVQNDLYHLIKRIDEFENEDTEFSDSPHKEFLEV